MIENIDNNHTIIIKFNFCRRDSESVTKDVSMSTSEQFLHHAEVKTDKDSPGVARLYLLKDTEYDTNLPTNLS